MSWARELGNVGRELRPVRGGRCRRAAANELLLATSGGANQPVYGEPAALEEHVPGGGGPSGAAHRVPAAAWRLLHHLEADLLLAGTEAGAVLAYQLHPSAAADDGSWDRCEPLGAAAVRAPRWRRSRRRGGVATPLCSAAARSSLRHAPPAAAAARALVGAADRQGAGDGGARVLQGSYLAEAGAAATVCGDGGRGSCVHLQRRPTPAARSRRASTSSCARMSRCPPRCRRCARSAGGRRGARRRRRRAAPVGLAAARALHNAGCCPRRRDSSAACRRVAGVELRLRARLP